MRSGQARWGLALLDGRAAFARDPVNGESWLRRAALAGDAEAAALVGDLYAKGGDLPPNFAEAASWYARAAEGGHAAAARALAMLLPDRRRRRRATPNEAARWFRISGERGDKLARSKLADLVLRGAASKRTGSAPASGSKPPRARATWSRPSTTAFAWPKASASSATSKPRRSGCAAPRTAS